MDRHTPVQTGPHRDISTNGSTPSPVHIVPNRETPVHTGPKKHSDTSKRGGGLPLEGVLALRSEEVHVGLELQLEDVLLVDPVDLLGGADRVA